MYQRREFLKTAAAGIAVTAITGNVAGCKSSSLFSSETIKQPGLQLYTLRDVLPKDPKGVLKQVAEMGYKLIESYSHDTLGIFWGMTNTEFKKYMDDLGMKIISSHCDINKDFEKKADEAAAIGMKCLICPSLPNEDKMSSDDYKKTADIFNQKGEVCKARGLRFAFHNHDQAFTNRPSGFVAEQVLLQNTDPSLVDFEMDIYWVVTAGQDPVKWFKQYPDRFKLCHIKDRKKGVPLSEREVSVTLGTGSIDFENILKTARKNGLQYYIVEQERYDNTTPIQAAKEDAEYLKKLKI